MEEERERMEKIDKYIDGRKKGNEREKKKEGRKNGEDRPIYR